ncbi:hypothetical protein [Micromonospora sp. NPDC005806]|uniref:hypothetical protein n=1 Tax=Micromonospora sp. NPDC005806 TaxID=3364234 RepID=UPI0036BB3950
MTGTSGADDGSHAGETDDTSPAAGAGETPESGQVPEPPEPAQDRRERWLTRARELRTTTRRRAKEWWKAAQPVLNQLRWPDQEPEPPAVALVVRRVSPTLPVPAQGQVYNFVVGATFTWSSDNARPELFGWYVDYFQPHATQRLRRIARRCAAEIPPDRPRELAIALEAALTGDDALPWGYERGGVTFTCEPEVSVHLDEPVRKLLQPYWDQRIALDWQRDLDRRRAEYAEDRRKRDSAERVDDGAAQAGMPEALREEHPPRQREAEAAPRQAGKQRGAQPDSIMEELLLNPLPQPPAARPPRPSPGEPASPQAGDASPAQGDPENGGPSEA